MTTVNTHSQNTNAALPHSAMVLSFSDDNVLFVANSDEGKITAYELPQASPAQNSAPYNLHGVGEQIAQRLQAEPHSIRYHDVAVHPVSKEVYIALSAVSAGQRVGQIVQVNHAGDITTLDVHGLKSSTHQLSQTADDGVTFWRDVPATTLTITDLHYNDGILYVSGLSTGEFASTLRKVAYPFNEQSQTASVEIYHTVHNQTETRAPIRAMTILDLDNQKTVVAAYTCTPLVTIAVDALTDGAHVKGKTIAELGYGNTPLSIIKFTAPNHEQQPEDYVLVFNKERDADLIRVADLVDANQKQGLSTPSMWAPTGVATRPLPLAGVLQADDQDEQFIVTLRRNMVTGDIDLLSFRKGAFFRLQDFISEYNFADYDYPPEQDFVRNFQNYLKYDAGYPELAVN